MSDTRELMTSSKFSTFLVRNVVTNAVLVAFLGQQLAFAAPQTAVRPRAAAAPTIAFRSVSLTPLAQAKTGTEGVSVIQDAEARAVVNYFENGGTPAEVKRFNQDIARLAEANALAGIADDLAGYKVWWQENQTSVILARSKMTTTNLQGLFIESYMKFKTEAAIKEGNESTWDQWFQNFVAGLTVKNISMTSLVIAVAVGTALGRTIHGAIIAGPLAGMVGAYLDSVVKPFKEKFAIWGGRNWGWAGAGLTRVLNRPPKAKKLTKKQLEDLRAGIGQAQDGQSKTYALLGRMGFEMSPEAFVNNVANMREIWNETNRAWGIYTTGSYKDGRSLITDAVSMRPFNFSGQIMIALNGAEIRRMSIRQITELIISRQGTAMQQTDALVKSLLAAVAERERSDQLDIKTAQAGVDLSVRALLALGATADQVEELITLRSTELAMVRHASAVLAANLIHDFHYEEFNRSLPDEAKKLYGELRSGYCLDYFHREFSNETARLLKAMDFQIEAVSADVTAGSIGTGQLKFDLEKEPVEVEGPTARAIKFVRSKARTTKAALRRLTTPEPRTCRDVFAK